MKKHDSQKTIQMMRSLAIIVGAATLIVGCASTAPVPTEQMIIAKSAVNNAISAGGNDYAPVQTKVAMDKLRGAEQAFADKDFSRAQQLAEQAQVDAQLATATARSVKAQKAAIVVQEDNRVLRQEIDRKTK